jgi:hypothetical protein
MSLRLTQKHEKTEDEDENEDEGCRLDSVPTTYYLLFLPSLSLCASAVDWLYGKLSQR